MQELNDIVQQHKQLIQSSKFSWSYVEEFLRRKLPTVITTGGKKAVSKAVDTGALAVGVTTGSSLAPLGQVLAPWIAAADIARQAGDIFSLHDLHDDATKARITGYSCKCGKCAEQIQYVIDKKERNVGVIAVSAFTAGLPAIAMKMNSLRKMIGQKISGDTGKKGTVSKSLVESARSGCTVATATIFLLSGNWEFMRGGNKGTMARAVAILISADGWNKLKSEW
jgi:bacterioferritin-associated ferredoxin